MRPISERVRVRCNGDIKLATDGSTDRCVDAEVGRPPANDQMSNVALMERVGEIGLIEGVARGFGNYDISGMAFNFGQELPCMALWSVFGSLVVLMLDEDYRVVLLTARCDEPVDIVDHRLERERRAVSGEHPSLHVDHK